MKKRSKDLAIREIERLWGEGVEVVDAVEPLRIIMLPEDVALAVPGDPANCALAQACHRLYGSDKVQFWRTVAYVGLPDESGKIRVERFAMTPEMRALIEAFDRGEGIIPEAGFTLKVVKPSKRLNAALASSRLREERRKAGIIGTRRGNQGVGRYKDKVIVKDLVRNGSGMVHFKPVKSDD